MDKNNAIEITNFCKKYDGFSIDNLSFSVPKGSIMGFVGQNGAGKSTTIKAILNIVKKDSGDIKIFGLDNVCDEKEIKDNIAVVYDSLPFPETLNAKQLDNVLKYIFKEWDSKTYYEYLKRFNLPINRKLGKFSKGMKMKIQIATALSHNAKLLIMDEATAGLDPVVRNEMLDVFMEYMQDDEHSILMSSHITSDLERIADSVTFIHNGKLILSGYKDDILASHAVIQCSKEMLKEISDEYIVSVRLNEFGASVMVKDRAACEQRYSGAIFDTANLDDILTYYVKGTNGKEWTM